jgi:PPOX class probable F420-dependent enzyme
MSLDRFGGHRYLNLETFRRNGEGVKTPVWFVREGNTLYVWTLADSGKARRIRRNGRVRIVPCTDSGDLLGDWLVARAEVDGSPEALRHVARLMRSKYGIAFLLFEWIGRLWRARYTTLRIRVEKDPAE